MNELNLTENMFSFVTQSPDRLIRVALANWEDVKQNIRFEIEKFKQGVEADKEISKIINISLSLYKDYYRKKSQTANWFVTGRANFNFSRNEKRLSAEDRAYSRAKEITEKLIKRAIKKLRPDLQIIKNGDDDAIERLENKIKKNEDLKEQMKKVNKILRNKKLSNDQMIVKIQEFLPNFHDNDLNILLNPKYSFQRKGFQSFELTNLGATIRNDKKRLEFLKTSKSQENEEVQKEGFYYVVNYQDQRIQVFFNGKPEAEVRAELKKHGFRWTPSLSAWQSYIHQEKINFLNSLSLN
jgi:acylphosphatase